MENIQKPKVGAGIKTLAIIQLVFSGFGLIGSIMAFFMTDATKAQLKTMGIPETSTSTLIIGLVLVIIVALGVILILMKKELGVYIYFVAEVANIMYTIVSTGFKPTILISLIIPVLMGIFIWKKKEIFFADDKVKM
ncbi:hypothetical protein [Clostridium psychrophilum]|uniref:hypothetical protein n=1 Tax=Clostridium psychrophilum TaxID=132926 RepID=UPI001C0E055D|nr:hypothetical protein [Clostridium psychrophilum]MBU3179721.1 hypothetical protein [Clostridium psychrophilum]